MGRFAASAHDMSVDFETPGDETEHACTGTTVDGPERPPIALRMITVAYADAPDESTIYPPDATGMDRMTTWITASDDAVVDLLDAR